jgi:hypothetical protein
LTEQAQALESQIVEQKEKVKAAAPDEKQLKQLEKMVEEYRKGTTPCLKITYFMSHDVPHKSKF